NTLSLALVLKAAIEREMQLINERHLMIQTMSHELSRLTSVDSSEMNELEREHEELEAEEARLREQLNQLQIRKGEVKIKIDEKRKEKDKALKDLHVKALSKKLLLPTDAAPNAHSVSISQQHNNHAPKQQHHQHQQQYHQNHQQNHH